jgi:hypothetical protein
MAQLRHVLEMDPDKLLDGIGVSIWVFCGLVEDWDQGRKWDSQRCENLKDEMAVLYH